MHPTLAAPGTFAALVKERRLRYPPYSDAIDASRYGAITVLSPDRLT